MRQKNQLMRFTDAELALMKAAFADNEDFLFLIRKFLLQGEITEEEKPRLTLSPALYALVRKMFIPEIDTEAPLFQLTDMAKGLDFSSRDMDEMRYQLKAKIIESTYLRQRFIVLLDGQEKADHLRFSDLSNLDYQFEAQTYDILIKVLARNWLLDYIDSRCRELSFLAGLKSETVEETVKRLQQNSNK